jgi:hypothetical protein
VGQTAAVVAPPRGLTQRELARRAGLESGDIHLLEGAHAEALVSVWLDIAAALKVSLAEFGEDQSSSRRPALRSLARSPEQVREHALPV